MNLSISKAIQLGLAVGAFSLLAACGGGGTANPVTAGGGAGGAGNTGSLNVASSNFGVTGDFKFKNSLDVRFEANTTPPSSSCAIRTALAPTAGEGASVGTSPANYILNVYFDANTGKATFLSFYDVTRNSGNGAVNVGSDKYTDVAINTVTRVVTFNSVAYNIQNSGTATAVLSGELNYPAPDAAARVCGGA